MKDDLLFLDLFAGAGGLSEGFVRAGFFPIAHVESDKAACFTLKTRMTYHWLKEKGKEEVYWKYLEEKIDRDTLYSCAPERHTKSVLNEEISESSLEQIFQSVDSLLDGRRLNLIIGGPPCQAYSIVGRSRDQNRMQGDKRNYYYRFYSQFLDRYNPECFVFENVVGLLSAKDESGSLYLDDMIAAFREVGYETEYRTLSAEEYGVPQARKRVILIGKKGKDVGFYPEFKKEQNQLSVNDILSDLPKLSAGEGKLGLSSLEGHAEKKKSSRVTLHKSRPNTDRDLKIYKIAAEMWEQDNLRLNYKDLPSDLKTHNNQTSFLDRFKVVAGDSYHSHTVVAHIAKDGHYYIHPDTAQNRSLTPREAARLQTFPDDYHFESVSGKLSQTPAFQQIGNAVPVVLAEKIAGGVKELISDE